MKWLRMMYAALALLAAPMAAVTPAVAVSTVTTTLTSSWQDLGAGPLLIGATGQALYQISDTAPTGAALNVGWPIPTNGMVVNTTSHIWAKLAGIGTATAFVAPVTASGGGGGGGTATGVLQPSGDATISAPSGNIAVTAGTGKAVQLSPLVQIVSSITSSPLSVTATSLGSNQPVATFTGGDTSTSGGEVKLVNSNAGALAPNKYIRVTNAGAFQLINSAYTAILNSIDDTGAMLLTAPGLAANVAVITAVGGDGTTNGGQIKMTNNNSGATLPSKTFRITQTGVLQIANNANNTIFSIDDSGNANPTGAMTVGGYATTGGYAMASLPTCNGSSLGRYAYMNNSAAITAASYMQPVASGGTTVVGVFCDGTGWKYR